MNLFIICYLRIFWEEAFKYIVFKYSNLQKLGTWLAVVIVGTGFATTEFILRTFYDSKLKPEHFFGLCFLHTVCLMLTVTFKKYTRFSIFISTALHALNNYLNYFYKQTPELQTTLVYGVIAVYLIFSINFLIQALNEQKILSTDRG